MHPNRQPDFNPSTLLTRAQVAGLLYQLFSDGAQPETASPFVDITEPWQTAPVLWLLANQITTGTSATTFDPDRNVTRGEFATFLWRHNQQPDPADRVCQPPPTVNPANPTPDAPADPFPAPPSQLLLSVERERMVAEDFERVAVYLTEEQAGCRPWADFPGPNGDTSFDGWAITPHHTAPGAGDCPAPPDTARYTHMFCAVNVDDWDRHRVMTVTSTGQNPPFITHLSPSNRRFQVGYWEITATRIN